MYYLCISKFIKKFVKLTDIILYPFAAKPSTCLKKISAVPLTGGRHISGHLMVFGLESYTFHP